MPLCVYSHLTLAEMYKEQDQLRALLRGHRVGIASLDDAVLTETKKKYDRIKSSICYHKKRRKRKQATITGRKNPVNK